MGFAFFIHDNRMLAERAFYCYTVLWIPLFPEKRIFGLPALTKAAHVSSYTGEKRSQERTCHGISILE